MDDNTFFYDFFAEETADRWYENDLLLPTIKEFIALFDGTPRILDLGCGTGHESMRLQRESAEVVGIDISPKSIQIAGERNASCEFHVMDFFNIEKTIGTFNGVFSSGSIIHVSPAEIAKLLNNMFEITEPDGYFEIVFLVSKGIRDNGFTIEGRSYKRLIYLYEIPDLINYLSVNVFEYVKEGFLAEELIDGGWVAVIFRRR